MGVGVGVSAEVAAGSMVGVGACVGACGDIFDARAEQRGHIDAAATPAYSCRAACASNPTVEVKLRGPGGRVEQSRLDEKKLPKKNSFPKIGTYFGYTFCHKTRYKACAAPS